MDRVALTVGDDDAGPAQHREVLGQVRGLDGELGEELADRPSALRERLERADADGVRKGL